MADTKENTYQDFYKKIKEQNGIEEIWKKLLVIVKDACDFTEEDNILKFFTIFFSLLDDGNTCACLDVNELFEKWNTKWNGLLMVSETKRSESEEQADDDLFKAIIKTGIDYINDGKCNNIAGTRDENKLFILKEIDGKKWIFPNKYFQAKLSIEARINVLMPDFGNTQVNDDECQNIIDYFKEVTNGMILEKKQALIIAKGLKENIVVTGGPGTGKTTAVCYLLWKLFQQTDEDGCSYCDYRLYLAAPSGKAAERMKESISDSLNDFKETVRKAEENQKIVECLSSAESYTVHRLLSYNPGQNNFSYNAKNQFNKKSIFIIDEASMIDIILFRNLLEAIPEGAKVFILGDADQLPSVQAGAVLEELVGKRKNNVVALTESKRFNSKSEVGRLKDMIEISDPFPADKKSWTDYGTWLEDYNGFNFADDSAKKGNPVFFYEFKEVVNKGHDETKREQLEKVLEKWSEAFCEDLVKKSLFEDFEDAKSKIKKLWEDVNIAKILCAENRGFRGVEEINENISKQVCKITEIDADDEGYFIGQPLIVTQNQKMFKLYNGDTGIVVGFKGNNTKYLMVEKKASEKESNETESDQNLFFRIGDFMFYTLSLLPNDSIETAYAITIHKSQGSGYKNIMVVLPEKPRHPLLNRQIVYTAITRTKGNTYIIATPTALNSAKETIIVRDTMLEF